MLTTCPYCFKTNELIVDQQTGKVKAPHGPAINYKEQTLLTGTPYAVKCGHCPKTYIVSATDEQLKRGEYNL